MNGDARFAALDRAGAAIKRANPNATLYYDSGHSDWRPSAATLQAAGVVKHGSGIFTNVSNHNTTATEASTAQTLLDSVTGGSGLKIVIDTSRNGNGPVTNPANDQAKWCDAVGRALGQNPTANTGDARVDAYLWGEASGGGGRMRGEAGHLPSGRGVCIHHERWHELDRDAAGDDAAGDASGDSACCGCVVRGVDAERFVVVDGVHVDDHGEEHRHCGSVGVEGVVDECRGNERA